MCGIVGYIGNKNASEIILDGLKRLEYRGYDSAGISTIQNGKISTTKYKGKVKYLENKLDSKIHSGTVGIGHTRWATHGSPSNENSHPHNDTDNKMSLVHNGIIENYYTLKKYLSSKNYKFKTETDTEVLVQLIHYIHKTQKGDFSESVRMALHEVVGTYGIVIMFEDEPDKLIVARLGSPLIIGIDDNSPFVNVSASNVNESCEKLSTTPPNIAYSDVTLIAINNNTYLLIINRSFRY